MTGSRLENSGWEPDEQARSFAKSYGLDPEKVWPEFRDYWIAKTGANATKKDWLATWRTWCRRAEGNPRLRLERAPAHLAGSPENTPLIPWDRLHKDALTGRPYAMVDNRRYSYLEASKIRAKSAGRWPLTDHELRVLDAWDMKPIRPAQPPTQEERAAYIEEMKERGLL